MICPQCGAEYKPDIVQCADCGVPLEAPPPEEVPLADAEFETVKADLDPGGIAVLRSILEDRQIEHTMRGETLGLYPSVGLVSATRLTVLKDRAAEVRELIQELEEEHSAEDVEEADLD